MLLPVIQQTVNTRRSTAQQSVVFYLNGMTEAPFGTIDDNGKCTTS